MTVEQVIASIASLPIEEQLKVVQGVWERMPTDCGTAIANAQREEFDRRYQLYERDPTRALTEEQFRAKLLDARS